MKYKKTIVCMLLVYCISVHAMDNDMFWVALSNELTVQNKKDEKEKINEHINKKPNNFIYTSIKTGITFCIAAYFVYKYIKHK